jgi:hypothetical protein
MRHLQLPPVAVLVELVHASDVAVPCSGNLLLFLVGRRVGADDGGASPAIQQRVERG